MSLTTDQKLEELERANADLRKERDAALSEKATLAEELAARDATLTQRNTEYSERIEHQAATVDVLRVMSASPGDAQPVFDLIVDRAKKLCDSYSVALYQYDGTLVHLSAFSKGSPAPTQDELTYIAMFPMLPTRSSIACRAILEGEIIHIRDMRADPNLSPAVRALDLDSILAIPLIRDGEVIGTFNLNSKAAGGFSDNQVALLQTFAEQAVIAITSAETYRALQTRTSDLQESLEYQTATSDVLKVIGRSTFDLQPVFETIVTTAGRLCGSRHANITTREGDGYRWVAGFSDLPGEGARRRFFPVDRASITGRTVLAKQAVQVADVTADPEYLLTEGVRRSGVRTVIGVPMMRDGVVVGTLNLGRNLVRPFSERQIELVRNFADQAVIAMENARLLGELRQRTGDLQESLEYQTATSDVLKVISRSTFDLQPVLDTVAETAGKLCDADRAAIYQREGGLARLVANCGFPSEYEALVRGLGAFPLDGYPQNVVPRAISEGRTVHIHDVAVLAGYGEGAISLGKQRTSLGVPLLREGEAVGAIVLARQRVEPFTDRQIELVSTFADQAVIAMENARLLDALRERTEALAQRNGEFGERIEQQSATIDVLKVMSSTPDNTQPVFELIVRRAQELCKGVGASLIELEGNLVHFRAAHEPASHTNDLAAVESWKALFPMVPTLEWLSCRAILEKREVHIRDMQADPGLSDIVRTTNSDIRSHLTVPLMRDGQAIGSISLRGKEPGGFTDSQVALLRTFAEQAVIAIGSVANFRALRERTAELAQRQAELRIIFENMGDGVAMFDETQHLVAWNRKFREILDVPDDIIDRHQTFSEYVRYLAERGEYDPEADAAEHVRRLIEQAGQSRTYERTRPDGRVIEIRHNPVPGGGFVLIYADITERKRSEAEIRAARDAAEEASRVIEAAYRDLKAAQANLIQAEKMASLGQLTAGIAHEIKNPLNFVNNFATLSVDLLDELKQTATPAFATLDADHRAEIDDLTRTLASNLEKINEHGKRADGIVKAMLEHSRGSSGERRIVDLNALIDDALNLAYHGARAQDQRFNITLERDFAEGIAPIELAPQDLTRVFLNLFSNGFYAATRRARNGSDAGFVPTLKVTTRDTGEEVEVRVRDNGIGVSADIRDKLFQPFFTTKPTGEGTGLGLSITYDIVTQQHGGSITVDSEAGEYSEFAIRLPRKP